MIDASETWRTEHLTLEPITQAHAADMHPVLADPALYTFTGGQPLSLDELRARYARLAARHSQDGSEIWCNWAMRETASGQLVGALQSTLPRGGPSADVAQVAWEVGLAFQRRGFATEAARALVRRLLDDSWCVVADIHPKHIASQRVADKVGLVPTQRIVDGEVRWWVDPWGGDEITDDTWEPWHPIDIYERLAGLQIPWAVAAGWALDLFGGAETREHEDLEIAVPCQMFEPVRAALVDFDFEVVGAGHRWPIDSPASEVMVQTWLRDRSISAYRLDVFREPHDGQTWICRREPSITRPYADVIETSADGIPYLAPEIVLLFKAKHDRAKDHADFEGTLPLLSEERRVWLREALALVHPGHTWLQSLP